MLKLAWRIAVEEFKARRPPPDRLNPKKIEYNVFHVQDDLIAQQMLNWYTRHDKATKAVKAFVKDILDRSSGRMWDNPSYILHPETGKFQGILFCGKSIHGWGRKKDTHFHLMEPQSTDAVREASYLPAVPTRKELNDLFGWPTFTTPGPHEPTDFYNGQVNMLPRITQSNGELYLLVPKAQNFVRRPDVHQAISAWQPPAFLKQVDMHERMVQRRAAVESASLASGP